MPAPFTAVPHAPVGAWTSLSFGQLNHGIAIQSDSLDAAPNADLLLAFQRDGTTHALPFIENPGDYPAWHFLPQSDITRTLTPCIDEFLAPTADITLRIYAPQAALPNPKRAGNLQFATAPGILIELTLDNSASDAPAAALVAIHSRSAGQLRPVDWTSKALCGIASTSRWILAASAVKDEIATIQASNLNDLSPRIDPASHSGGITIKVPPRSTKTVTLVFATYQQGLVTQGIEARYFYSAYFPRMEAVANFLLQNAQRVRESCTGFDNRAAAACADSHKLLLLTHGLRAYNASTQVIDAETPAGPAAYFAIIAPTGPRNTLDRASDHLPWELFRNPWVIRNLFDLATSTYAYHDKVRFPSDAETPDELRTGGMTFARDFGFASAYAPGAAPAAAARGMSAFDGAGTAPGWAGGTLATEILLNSIYMLTSYALSADDTPWAKTRLPFARELLKSLENRDHWDPEKRTGILKAQSASSTGPEQTSFGTPAYGSPSIALKTFCANLLLTTYFQNNNDLHSADYSYAFAQKTAAALVAIFNKESNSFPSSLLTRHSALSSQNAEPPLAALEPLALPTFLGLTSTLPEYFPELFAALKSHAETCLKSFNPTSIPPGKLISVLYVLERLFQLPLPADIWENLATLPQLADQSQLLTASLFLKAPSAAAQ